MMIHADSAPGHRRQRRPQQPVPGYPEIAALRHDGGGQPVAPRALPVTPPAHLPAMARILRLATTGVWSMRLSGRFVEVEGRMHWNSQDELMAAARRSGITLSDLVVNTGR